MGANDSVPHQQEIEQLFEAYSAIRDDRVRYFMSMMLQCVAIALTEAQEDNTRTSRAREKSRPHLAA